MRNFWKNNAKGLAVLLTGLLVLVLGVFRGEVAVVFEKAVRICLGCIGIG